MPSTSLVPRMGGCPSPCGFTATGSCSSRRITASTSRRRSTLFCTIVGSSGTSRGMSRWGHSANCFTNTEGRPSQPPLPQVENVVSNRWNLLFLPQQQRQLAAVVAGVGHDMQENVADPVAVRVALHVPVLDDSLKVFRLDQFETSAIV